MTSPLFLDIAHRLRDNVDRGSPDQTDAVMALTPVTFRYKEGMGDGNQRIRPGLVAEQVAEVAPELVYRGRDGQPEGVWYADLVPMLLSTIQRLEMRIEKLEDGD